MGDPLRAFDPTFQHRTGESWTQHETPAQRCSECFRLAEQDEQQGKKPRTVNRVREWVASRYFGALCQRHSEEERCWRFQQELQRRFPPTEQEKTNNAPHVASKDEKEFLASHETGCARVGMTCRCMDVAQHGMPLSLMNTDERDEAWIFKRLHPCSGGCSRMLVAGVGRCWQCQAKP